MKPVVLLAFANERESESQYLRNLPLEQNALRKALEKAEDSGLCELVILPNATLENLTETFQRKKYANRIAIFHYGGHASSYKLLLEAADGSTKGAHSAGLVPFLAAQKGLKLVFLNGCNSARQAQELTEAGIPICLGTVQAVSDKVATDLAQNFYRALGEGLAIEQAWNGATHILNASTSNDALYSKRSIVLEEEQGQFPWELFVRPGAEDHLSWNLPEAAENPYFGLPNLEEKFDLPEEPYRFLERYTEKDARIFFGRGNYIRDIFQRLTDQYSAPCLLFYGQSGVGKSSLLEAGLFPRLEVEYEIQTVRRDPEIGLLGHLKEMLGGSDNLREAWKQKEATSEKKGLVLILDQVEEVFTRPRGSEPGELASFMAELAHIFSKPQDRPAGKILLSYRKEYDSEIEKACRQAGIPKEKIFLDRLDRSGIVEVVKGLTSTTALQQKYRLTIEEDLPVVIADDLLVDRDSPISPVLQIIMTRLWKEDEAKEQRHFSVQDYNGLRKEGVLLDDFFRQQMQALEDWEKEHQTNVVSSGLALDILKFHTTQLTTATSRDLVELKTLYSNRKDILEPLLQKMSDLYLLANIDNQKSILAHDTLAPIVRQQLNDSDKPGQRALRILQSKGLDYKLDPQGTYIDEADLKIVEDGADGIHAWTEEERALIDKSRKRRDRLKRIRKIRIIALVLAIIAILVLAAVSIYFGLQSALQARVNEKIAEASRVVRTDATKAYQIVSEALQENPTDKNALQTRYDIYRENEFYHQQMLTSSIEIEGQDYWIEAIALSADAELIAVAVANRVMVWNKAGELVSDIKHNDAVNGVQFTDNDNAIFSICDNQTAYLWNVDGSLIDNFKGHNDFLETGYITDDGTYMLTGGYEGGVYLWNKNGTILDSIQAHNGFITSLAMNATYDTLYTGGEDKLLKIWHWNGSKIRLINSVEYKARIISIAYNENAPFVLAAYRDGTVKLLKRNGEQVKEIKAHDKRINKIVYSRDGQHFLTGSKDYQVKLWNLEGDLVKTYKGHDHIVMAVDFDESGQNFVSADAIGKINLWKRYSKAEQTIELGDWGVESMDLSSDGNSLLVGTGIKNYFQDFDLAYETADQNFPVILVDLEDQQQREIGLHKDVIQDVAFSQAADQLISVSRSGRSKLWNKEGQMMAELINEYTENVFSGDFLGSDNKIITIEDDTTSSIAYFWDNKGKLLQQQYCGIWINDIAIHTATDELFLVGEDDNGEQGFLLYYDGEGLDSIPYTGAPLNSIALSDKYIACGESGSRARIFLYDLTTFEPVHTDWNLELFVDNKSGGRGINALSFSNDGRYLVVGAEGGEFCLFDLESEAQAVFGTSDFGENNINGLAFSNDNKWIIVGSSDGNIRIYANLINNKPSFQK